MESTIREVLVKHGKLGRDAMTIGTDEDLFALGLTSHASVTVMIALEVACDVEFPGELLTKTTFSSINNIADAIDGLRAAA